MAEVATNKKRIFHIAKELNISHMEIIELLKNNGVEVHSHMSPVDESAYQLILDEFEKDRQTIERYRKEKVRKEIHDRRIQSLQDKKKFIILMPDEQRKLEEKEKAEADRIAKEKVEALKKVEAAKKAEEIKKKAAEKREQEKASKKVSKKTEGVATEQKIAKKPEKVEEQPEVKEKAKSKKLKLRKVDLSEIAGKIESSRRKPHKKSGEEKSEQKEKSSIDTTIRKTLAKMDTKSKKRKYRKVRVEESEEIQKDKKNIKVQEYMSVQELANLLDISSTDVITKCFELGVVATINQRLDLDTISLIADDFGFRAEQVEEITDEIFSLEFSKDDLKKAVPRAPVVTIMGHVDHGKTSLLDFIRNENVVAGESGGITQHIGAYEVELEDGRKVTFLDTPGHEAFTAMRARGAQITDVVILIVAADDGVKPQTAEAINHAKAAKVPIVVAINKIDKPNADPDRVKRELAEHEILVEDWGGDYQCKEISAKTGKGIDELLELLALETEILELKANPDTEAIGTVIESRLDKGHGAIGTVLIQKGTLKIGDPFVCGNAYGKVRALLNERGIRVKSAGPSSPIQVLGYDMPPQAGDQFAVIVKEKEAKRLAEDRERVQREIDRQKVSAKSLDRFSEEVRLGIVKALPLVIKADVDGSIEALEDAFSKIYSGEEVKINVIHTGVGTISESDVLLAAASNAIIIGFHVKINSNANLLSKKEGIEIRTYEVIYEAINDIRLALEGLLEPEIVEEALGKAEVKAVYKISRLGYIAGCQVIDGKITRNDYARVVRDDEVVFEGNISSLKRFQEDTKEVTEGKECGIGVEGISKFIEGDIIHTYATKEIKRTLS